MVFRTRDEQIARNRMSRERWAEFSSHRERVTQLLAQPEFESGRLLVLGAGNCNDLDLQRLLTWFSEIHLLDLDLEALVYGVERQGLVTGSNIFLHGGIDVTGIAEICSAWNDEIPPSQSEISEAVRRALGHNWSSIDQHFDVTVSIGLLSQLAEMIIRSLGNSHSRVMELLSAMRLRHMQLLMESVRPGGQGVLVTEIVSSSSCPELTQTPESGLSDLLRRLITSGNFFTGQNPAIIESLWRQSPELAPLVEQVEFSGPWLWDFGPRVYACYALSGVRRSG